jgi:hypothetical protein
VEAEAGDKLIGEPGDLSMRGAITATRTRSSTWNREQVGVSYRGKGTAASASRTERYRLLVERPREQGPPIDSDRLEAPDEDSEADDEDSHTAAAVDDDIPSGRPCAARKTRRTWSCAVPAPAGDVAAEPARRRLARLGSVTPLSRQGGRW